MLFSSGERLASQLRNPVRIVLSDEEFWIVSDRRG
jgi:hypothetical protein